MKFIGIIPARYGSTRFPGKPLAEICGKTVIRRVYEQATKALDTVLVATDDDRIYDTVEAFGGKVVMTRADHKCGTDRCLEAYRAITTPIWRDQNNTDTVIINIQGDEPFIRQQGRSGERQHTESGMGQGKRNREDVQPQSDCMFGRKSLPPYRHLCLPRGCVREDHSVTAESAGERREAGAVTMVRERLFDSCGRDRGADDRD